MQLVIRSRKEFFVFPKMLHRPDVALQTPGSSSLIEALIEGAGVAFLVSFFLENLFAFEPNSLLVHESGAQALLRLSCIIDSLLNFQRILNHCSWTEFSSFPDTFHS